MQKQHTWNILTLKYYILWILEHFIQGLLAYISYRKTKKRGREEKVKEKKKAEKRKKQNKCVN